MISESPSILPQHHLKSLRELHSPLSAAHSRQPSNILLRPRMRIRPHHAPVHRKRLALRFHTILPHLDITIRTKQIHSSIDSPLSTRRHLHIPELPHALHLRTTLEQPNRLLTSHRSLQMIIIRISRVMRNNHIRLTPPNRSLDKLHQLQVRHSVHLNVRERPLKLPLDPQKRNRRIRITLQLRIRRSERPRLRLSTHYTNIHLVAIVRPHPRIAPSGCSSTLRCLLSMLK